MKNIITSIVIAGSVALTTNYAIADSDDGVYVGVQYAVGNFTMEGIPAEFNPNVVVTRFGKFHNDNFALEARMGFSAKDSTKSISGADVTVNMDPFIGGYGIGHINLSETSSVYGLVGVTYAQATARRSDSGLSVSDRDNGLSIGVGGDVEVGNNIALNIEYVSYLNNNSDGFDFNALGFGIMLSY